MVLRGDLTIGEMVAFLLFLTSFFAPIQTLVQLFNQYQQGSAAITKLRGVLATEPSVPEAPDAHELPAVDGHLLLESVTFGYDPDHLVLREVDLEVAPGEVLAVVGATGAGKSTVAKLVTRFYDPDFGHVRLDGHDLRDVTLASLRRQVGVVPQEPFLFNGSIRQNVAFARPASLLGSTRRSTSAAPRCPPASGNSWRWPGCSSPGPGCWYWTRPPRTWTCSRRPSSNGPSTRCSRAARR